MGIKTNVSMLTGGSAPTSCTGRQVWEGREDGRHSGGGKPLAIDQVLQLQRGG